MASNAQNSPSTVMAASSTTESPAGSSSEAEPDQRPQAGPLPRKAGEIGYVASETAEGNGEDMVDVPLAPHPAERNNTNNNSTNTQSSSTSGSNSQNPTSSTHSTHSTKKSILKFLHVERPMPKLGGIRLSTLIRLVVTLLTLTGTAIGWALIIVRMSHSGSSNASNPPPEGTTPDMALSAFVFVHVAFGIGTIFQLLLLERTVFLARAERYSYLHPEARAANPNNIEGFRSLAPWARPPLPTYASALGFRGTGDVEDNAISIPPPPAYGNTRGSTLLLASVLRNSLIERNTEAAIRHGSRCVSYSSISSRTECEMRCTAEERATRTSVDRARRIEEALGRLENGRNQHQSAEPSPPSPAVLRG